MLGSLSIDIQHAALVLSITCFLFCGLALIVPFFLIGPLNRKFDPDLERHVTFLQHFAGITSEATRASLYAALVFSKKLFGINQPHYINYDFRSKISRRVYLVCCAYTLMNLSLVFVILPLTYVTTTYANEQHARLRGRP